MPRGSANLPPDTVTDLITYILAMNNFPPGDRNLPTDVDFLGRIRILGKEGPMPAEVGQLVRTIGCLAPGPSNGWVLTSAVPPERSRQSEPSAHSEIGAMAARSLGDRTIRLVSIDPDAQENKGQKRDSSARTRLWSLRSSGVRSVAGDALSFVFHIFKQKMSEHLYVHHDKRFRMRESGDAATRELRRTKLRMGT